MKTEISNSIYYVGVNDRTKHRFEALWPLPLGVSYNSYLIVDEKVVLVDTVDHCHGDLFLSNIRQVIGDRPIDYLVVNHMEPDHSAALSFITHYYPNIQIIGNNKTQNMIEGFYGVFDRFIEVKDNSTLSLGEKTLRFFMTPMIHWPETMMTYIENDKVLFTGDAFGCFGTIDGGVIDEEMNTDRYWDEMYRYYSNIVGKYGAPVQKALSKLADLEIKLLCTTHGPVWKKHIEKVISLYDRMSRYDTDEGVVIAYGSMYGNTEQMAEIVARQLSVRGIKNIVMHNVSKSDPSYILLDVFKYKGLIIGSPTYTNELFPNIESLISKLASRDIKNRILGYFGSYTWSSAAVKRLTTFAENVKWEIAGKPIEMKQGMSPDVATLCIELADDMADKLIAARNNK